MPLKEKSWFSASIHERGICVSQHSKFYFARERLISDPDRDLYVESLLGSALSGGMREAKLGRGRN